MRRVAAILVGLPVAAAIAAGTAGKPKRPATRGAADGGDRPIVLGPDKPGRLKPTPDAGTDGGSAQDARVELLERDLEVLRSRIDTLERGHQQLREQAAQQQQILQQLEALRQQIATADAQREEEAQAKQDQRDAVQGALRTLNAVDQRLAVGDYDVDAALASAQAALPEPARTNVRNAREALRNRDLANARASITAAAVSASRD
jgi:hypothetical protein